MISSNMLKQLYFDFFKKRNHAVISGRSLVPENDPTALFNTAGMQPLVPYLLGKAHPQGKRLVNYQRCLRTVDIDIVGDDFHLTFFEMLGNWSLGDYFKKESIEMSYEFLIEVLKLPLERLYFTVFKGEAGIERDEESAQLWRSLGISSEKIFYLGLEDNFWGPVGQEGPCGPDTEIFFDTLKEACSKDCKPGCACGKYFEIWNNVFIMYNKQGDQYLPLLQRSVDTGMGVERTTAVLNDFQSVYDIDVLKPLVDFLKALGGERKIFGIEKKGTGKEKTLGEKSEEMALRIVSDHARSMVFILGDAQETSPSNTGRGYVLRKLIRRSMLYLKRLGFEFSVLIEMAQKVFEVYREYEDLELRAEFVFEEIKKEIVRFQEALIQGEQEFEKLVEHFLTRPTENESEKRISGKEAFRLYDTFGFPLEMTKELAHGRGFEVDEEGFRDIFEEHKKKSRQGAQGSFKGGLADRSEESTRLHTTLHLLHEVLRKKYGPSLLPKGNNITPQRIRFDFAHAHKLSDQELREVEEAVNFQIQREMDVVSELMSVQEALERGALGFFQHKYDEKVYVYSIGDFSREICGGPHVENTRELGTFKIVKEEKVASGIRRIKAVLV